MSDRLRGFLFTALLLMLTAFFPRSAFAQCDHTFVGILAVGDMPGSPFQADLQFTNLSPDEKPAIWPHQEHREHIVRDAQGRIRIYELGAVGGENGDEPKYVTICDAVEGRRIYLDTVNKTALVRKMDQLTRQKRTVGTQANDPGRFCYWRLRIGVNLNGGTVEDIGRRKIEGVDAQGSLERRPPLPSRKTTEPSAPRPTYTSETWCSEDLGADVLRIMGTVEKGASRTASMTNVQRGEPDPALFQIPPGYRVIEREDKHGADSHLGGSAL